MNFWGLTVCRVLRKHKKGKRVDQWYEGTAIWANFMCPRCEAIWKRKVKANAASV